MIAGVAALVVCAMAVGQPAAAPNAAAIVPSFPPELADAAQLAEKSGRILLVVITDPGCGACKRMDAEVWGDAAAVAAIEREALVVRRELAWAKVTGWPGEVEGTPTFVAVKGGGAGNAREVGRGFSYRAGADLAAWAADLRAGKTGVEHYRRLVGERGGVEDGRTALLRYRLAEELVRTGATGAAGDLEWVWRHRDLLDSVYADRVGTFWVELAARDPEVKGAAARLARDLTPMVQRDDAEVGDASDWLTLTEAAGEGSGVPAWFWERAKTSEGQRLLVEVRGQLWGVLEACKDWKGVRRLAQLAAGDVDYVSGLLAPGFVMSDPTRPVPEKLMREVWVSRRSEIVRVYKACLATGAFSQGAAVAARLLERLDDAPTRTALVEAAVEVGVARPEHRRWLAEAAAAGADTAELAAKLRALEDKK